jgi:hypothetical protein
LTVKNSHERTPLKNTTLRDGDNDDKHQEARIFAGVCDLCGGGAMQAAAAIF